MLGNPKAHGSASCKSHHTSSVPRSISTKRPFLQFLQAAVVLLRTRAKCKQLVPATCQFFHQSYPDAKPCHVKIAICWLILTAWSAQTAHVIEPSNSAKSLLRSPAQEALLSPSICCSYPLHMSINSMRFCFALKLQTPLNIDLMLLNQSCLILP